MKTSKVTDLQHSALAEVQTVLNKFISIKAKANEMYKKNISLALLETTFRLPATLLNPSPDHKGLTPRVIQIGLFLENYYDRLSAFDDVKDYVAQLTFEEAKAFTEDVLAKMLENVSNMPHLVRCSHCEIG